jgi:hypothetical protein
MPDRDPEAQQSARLLTALIWAGVVIAPVAALVVLLGGGDGSIRFAVLLVAVCVVLMGASMLIRNDPVLHRMDIEERVAVETEDVRERLRGEIAAAARATSHRVQVLQDEITRLRAAGSPITTLPPPPPQAARPAPPQVARPAGARVPAAAVPPGPSAAASVSVPTGSAAVGSARVGSASAGPGSGPGRAGSLGAAFAIPHPRAAAAVRPPGGGDRRQGYGAAPAPQPGTVHRAGSISQVDLVFQGGVGDYHDAEQRPSRRHAAPDTGTDLARFGIDDQAGLGGTDWGRPRQAATDEGYGPHGGYHEPATGGYDYGYSERAVDEAGYHQPPVYGRPSTYGYDQGAGHDEPAGYDQGAVYGRADQFGPDPMAARAPGEYGRW